MQRRFSSEFHRDAPTRVTISQILDNFENHGTIKCMRKGHLRRKRTSTNHDDDDDDDILFTLSNNI